MPKDEFNKTAETEMSLEEAARLGGAYIPDEGYTNLYGPGFSAPKN